MEIKVGTLLKEKHEDDMYSIVLEINDGRDDDGNYTYSYNVYVIYYPDGDITARIPECDMAHYYEVIA